MSDLVDWIVAEWIATRVAGRGPAGPRPTTPDLSTIAAEAQRRVVAYTGLVPDAPLPAPEAVDRREWVRANLTSMRSLMEPVLTRAGRGLGPAAPAAQLAIGAAVSTELGLLVGYLAQRVLGQYELVLVEEADPHPPRLLLVMPNLTKAVAGFGADADEFLTWVMLHEVTHAVQFGAVGWLKPHLSGLIGELMASAEVRMERPRRLSLPTAAGVRRVGRSLIRADLIGALTSPTERATIDRIQAVMAVIEGHAEHVMDAVAPELLPSLPRLRAALDARRTGRMGPSRLIGRLLGLELKLAQYARGKVFCDAIVAAAGTAALAHLFSAPSALPTRAELEDPAGWLARTAAARGG
ncbi:zinc-dependent metalloprotease [Conexibacter sp. DBS9H8]|uniref:zinc-dependent metalloprotease n=1 Tax=Conexibacter sp. DBS9H8 TaxID=2937801 RepID=UPI0020104BA5|nr:zinc-dependent metalloprotease [Conexibacter sp. DBS9H8]